MLLNNPELIEKLESFFDNHSGHLELKSFKELKDWVWDYANKCWKEGKEFGECDCDCPL